MVDDTTDRALVHGHLDYDGWADRTAREVLQLLADSVVHTIGFRLCVVNAIIGEQMIPVSVAGPVEVREAVLGTTVNSRSIIDATLRAGVPMGRFCFVSHEQALDLPGHWVTPTLEQNDQPHGWHPDNVLLAPLHSRAGELIGALSVDDPIKRLLPDVTDQVLMDKCVVQAERALQMAFERERNKRELHHARAARLLVRAASRQTSVEAVVTAAQTALQTEFDAREAWLRLNQGADSADPILTGPTELAGVWASRSDSLHLSEVELDIAGQPRSVLIVPLRQDHELLGGLVMTRAPTDPEWSSVEREAVADIAIDLAAALARAEALEQQQAAVDELTRIAVYKDQMMATMSHELRSPLAAVSGHLELLYDDADDLSEDWSRSLAAMGRGVERLTRVVNDLLILARFNEPSSPVARGQVDFEGMVGDVLDFFTDLATQRGVTLVANAADRLPTVLGDQVELDRMLSNLVSNAIKYTDAGGTVTVEVRQADCAIDIVVADTGIGISGDDRELLFREFSRARNPEAARRPGTGLGLVIASRIAARHGGEILLDSAPGSGSVFTVRLPTECAGLMPPPAQHADAEPGSPTRRAPS